MYFSLPQDFDYSLVDTTSNLTSLLTFAQARYAPDLLERQVKTTLPSNILFYVCDAQIDKGFFCIPTDLRQRSIEALALYEKAFHNAYF